MLKLNKIRKIKGKCHEYIVKKYLYNRLIKENFMYRSFSSYSMKIKKIFFFQSDGYPPPSPT